MDWVGKSLEGDVHDDVSPGGAILGLCVPQVLGNAEFLEVFEHIGAMVDRRQTPVRMVLGGADPGREHLEREAVGRHVGDVAEPMIVRR